MNAHDAKLQEERMALIAHEIRNPLHAIHETLGVMTDGLVGELTDPQRDMLQIVQTDIRRLQRLTDNLLSVAKLKEGALGISKQPQALHPLLTDMLQLLNAQHQVSITLDYSGPTAPIMMDADRIQQVVLNLISNAIKVVDPTTGEIVITVRTQPGNGRDITIITVQDNGPGIPADKAKDLFKRFSQMGSFESRKQGVGLGLSICKDLITLHGGQIWIDSDKRDGAAFSFSLPHLRNTPEIVVVDPGDAVVAKLSDLATVRHHTTVESGIDDISRLHPDLTCINLGLPHQGGFALLHQLKQDVQTGTIPVVAIQHDPDQPLELLGLMVIEAVLADEQIRDTLARYGVHSASA